MTQVQSTSAAGAIAYTLAAGVLLSWIWEGCCKDLVTKSTIPTFVEHEQNARILDRINTPTLIDMNDPACRSRIGFLALAVKSLFRAFVHFLSSIYTCGYHLPRFHIDVSGWVTGISGFLHPDVGELFIANTNEWVNSQFDDRLFDNGSYWFVSNREKSAHVRRTLLAYNKV